MAVLKQQFDTEEDVTIVLASLADDTPVASSEIDNSSDLYLDYKVRFRIKTGASGVSATGKIFIYAIGMIDDSGRTDPSNLKDQVHIGFFEANVNATTFTSNEFSVKKTFNGVLPRYFKIVVDNQTGAALDSTEGSHDKRAQGQWIQSV